MYKLCEHFPRHVDWTDGPLLRQVMRVGAAAVVVLVAHDLRMTTSGQVASRKPEQQPATHFVNVVSIIVVHVQALSAQQLERRLVTWIHVGAVFTHQKHCFQCFSIFTPQLRAHNYPHHITTWHPYQRQEHLNNEAGPVVLERTW